MVQMKPFRDWSIRHKLTGLFIAMALITALMVSVPIGAFDLIGLRRAMALDLATLADVLARNSTAALTFHDVDAARDVLQALRAEPSVTAACIYTENGKPFAQYVRREVLPTHPSHFDQSIFLAHSYRTFDAMHTGSFARATAVCSQIAALGRSPMRS